MGLGIRVRRIWRRIDLDAGVDELRYIACFTAWSMGYVLQGAGWASVILEEIGYRVLTITVEGQLGEVCRRGVCGRDLTHYSALRLC